MQKCSKMRIHARAVTDLSGYRAETEDTDKWWMVAAKHDFSGRMATAHACGSFAAWIRLELRLLDSLVRLWWKE